VRLAPPRAYDQVGVECLAAFIILAAKAATVSLTLEEKRWLQQRPASALIYWLSTAASNAESAAPYMELCTVLAELRSLDGVEWHMADANGVR